MFLHFGATVESVLFFEYKGKNSSSYRTTPKSESSNITFNFNTKSLRCGFKTQTVLQLQNTSIGIFLHQDLIA